MSFTTLAAALALSSTLVACAGPAGSGSSASATFTPEEELGKKLFEVHCSTCHSTIPETIIVGPSLAGIASRAAERVSEMSARQYLEMSVERPGEYLVDGYDDLMPRSLAESIGEEEIDAILAYLMTLEE